MACEMSDIKKLHYEICKYSSYSTSYLPENIREDCPHNQTSRWSSNTNSPPQFLTLKLQRPAIVKKIKFGKYEKTHVCNLKKFKVLGGLEQDHLVLLFEGGLINDSTPETFNLRHTTDSGELLPVLYIQIMPLLSWGPSFNFSIWYVELLGEDDPIFVRTSLRNYNMLREVEIVKLCLKHFRQQGYDLAFKALQEQTDVRLEHPLMSALHHSLVMQGDFDKTEKFIAICVQKGLMDEYLMKQDYKATWSQAEFSSEIRPGTRGGHQLIIDSNNGLMYLYGGWDGFEDLSDLWVYHIKTNAWVLIHERSELFEGPTPRSCHKMVYDPISEKIFMLGRYLDNSVRTKEYIKSDFYLYDTSTKKWFQICDDTSQVGGPQLVYDHQMCIDVDKRTIYVFGGKILTPKDVNPLSHESQYSGLYSYHIPTNTWTQILIDCGHPIAANPNVQSIKARVMHCMVFHNKKRKLYIFGGHRGKDDIEEFIAYDVDNHKISVLNADDPTSDNKNEPLPGCTRRATLDCDKDEIYCFSSLNKLKDRREPTKNNNTSNSFWMYSLKSNTWSCIYKSDHSSDHCYTKSQTSVSEPCPRYAHQLVYDHVNKAHYLFGGNPGKASTPQLRLDDFWVLLLEKPSREQILLHCKYLIRRLKYEEIARENPLKAVQYLQNDLSSVIDHSDTAQLKNFHKLAYLLFKNEDYQTDHSTLMTVPLQQEGQSSEAENFTGESSMDTISDEQSLDATVESAVNACATSTMTVRKSLDDHLFEIKNQRCLLYNRLVELLPEKMVQPKGNLSDFVLI